MSNQSENTYFKTPEKKERQIARIIKLLQSATLDQLKDLEVFIITYLT